MIDQPLIPIRLSKKHREIIMEKRLFDKGRAASS